MKKNIFVIRHGHADLTATKDFERVLTIKGITAVNRAADFISQTCHEQGIAIDLCLCSAANRTKQTAEIICFKNDIENFESYQELYSTVASSWIDKIAKTDFNNIVIVGHNPTFSQLVSNLCGREVYMQPAHCAFISLELKEDGIIYPAQLNQYFNNE